MRMQQKMAPEKSKLGRRTNLKLRHILFGVIALLLCVAGIVWILSIGRVISGTWAVVLPVVLVVLAAIFALGQWLIPLSSSDSNTSDVPAYPPVQSPLDLPIHAPAPTNTADSLSRPWNVPYARNPFFTGREELLQQLHRHFSASKSGTAALTQAQAISGLGGIGKTQAAVEYAYRYRDECSAVFWVSAASAETLSEGFAAIARLLNLPEKDEPDRNIVVQAVRNWLATHSNWLLLLDNADDFELLLKHLNTYLPSEGQGHVLITTREQATGAISNFQVDKMDREEGILLLLRRAHILLSDIDEAGDHKDRSNKQADAHFLLDTPLSQASPADQATAAEIVTALDGLPLALDQAAAYIEETGCSLTDYLEAYRNRKRQVDLLKQRGRTSPDHPDSVVTTWALSFEKIEQLQPPGPLAADLLRFLAFLAPDNIPEELILQGASQLGPQLQQLTTDPSLLNDALAILRRYSLIRRDPANHTLTIHRLVQSVLRFPMSDEIQRQWAERTIKAVNSAFPDVKDINSWPQCELFLPHVLACAQLIDEYAFTFIEAARLLNKVAYYLDYHAQYKQAEPLLKRALEIEKQQLGSQHSVTATTLNNLAGLYYAQGKYKEAELLYQQALEIYEQQLGRKHPYTVTALNNLTELYRAQGKYKEAEPLYRRALKIREQQLGPEHPDTAQSLNNLALLYYAQGKYKEAEPLFKRALKIVEQQLGPEHPNTAQSLNNLAGLYEDQGKYKEAESLYRRALAIDEQQLGPEHPHTATCLNNLALLYHAQGKYEEAESLLRRALEIMEKRLPGHPNTVSTRESYEILLREMKQRRRGKK